MRVARNNHLWIGKPFQPGHRARCQAAKKYSQKVSETVSSAGYTPTKGWPDGVKMG